MMHNNNVYVVAVAVAVASTDAMHSISVHCFWSMRDYLNINTQFSLSILIITTIFHIRSRWNGMKIACECKCAPAQLLKDEREMKMPVSIAIFFNASLLLPTISKLKKKTQHFFSRVSRNSLSVSYTSFLKCETQAHDFQINGDVISFWKQEIDNSDDTCGGDDDDNLSHCYAIC